MIFFSVAEATKHLGIDAKTLHRWLADAHLPLQSHPRDGRKKGVSEEHVQILARLHHRTVASLREGPPIPLPPSQLSQASLVPPELLEILPRLQAQIAALQEHMADLTRLLQSQEHVSSAPAAASTKSAKASVSKPAPRVPRSRPAVAKAPPKPVHVIPRVEYGEQGRYVVICPKKGLLPLEPDTEEWFAWVAEQDSFRFVGKLGYFTAHHWWRVPRGAWRAHRHIRNQSYVLRLAPNHELTIAVLEQAAQELQTHLA